MLSFTKRVLHYNDMDREHQGLKSVPTVHNLGAICNDTMTKSKYVSTVCGSVNYHIKNIRK